MLTFSSEKVLKNLRFSGIFSSEKILKFSFPEVDKEKTPTKIIKIIKTTKQISILIYTTKNAERFVKKSQREVKNLIHFLKLSLWENF